MTKLTTFNASDNHVQNRLHLNETNSDKLQVLDSLFLDEFKKISTYPDPSNTELINTLAEFYHVPKDMLILGNGVDEIVLLMCLTFLKGGKSSLIAEQTFPGYETSTIVVGGKNIKVPLVNLKCNLERFKDGINDDVAVAFLCNPHNPTGSLMRINEVEQFIEVMNQNNIIPIIDEAYIQFADEQKHSVLQKIANGANAIVLRTFSKAYGLAGLRVGFAMGPKALIDLVAQSALALPFRVNRFAQRLAGEVLSLGTLEKTVQEVNGLMAQLTAQLSQNNIEFVPSSTNFMCFKPHHGTEQLMARANHLGTQVRDCTAFGLSGWIRASICSQQDLHNLLNLLSIVPVEAKDEELLQTCE